MACGESIAVEVFVDSEEHASEVESSLQEAGAIDIGRLEQHGILPIIGIVVGAVIAVTAAADLVSRILKRRECQEIIDVSSGSLKISENCKRKDGSITVITKEGIEVEITNVPDGIDVTKIAESAISGGGRRRKLRGRRSRGYGDGAEAGCDWHRRNRAVGRGEQDSGLSRFACGPCCDDAAREHVGGRAGGWGRHRPDWPPAGGGD
jgi:hypothetical protein